MVSSDRLPGRLRSRFLDLFGEVEDLRFAIAPGRVNLIGEHTDYNDGWVLPMAIDRYVGVAFRGRGDRLIRAHSIAYNQTAEIELDRPGQVEDRAWVSYVAGMMWMIAESASEVSGIDCVIDGNVPLGSGLSSSAALEMAIARALCAASEIPWYPRSMARLGQQAEHRFVGVKCGLMDQLASALAEEDCALLLDCRSTAAEAVQIPEAARVVVMDTGARRALANSAYNDRQASCETAVRALRLLEPEVRARFVRCATWIRVFSKELATRWMSRPSGGQSTWSRRMRAPSPWPERFATEISGKPDAS
jgi:galactokinase